MLKDIYRNLLIEINEDVNRDGLIKTPERAAKALEYLVSGYNRDIHEIVNGALFDVKCEDIVVVKILNFIVYANITFYLFWYVLGWLYS